MLVDCNINKLTNNTRNEVSFFIFFSLQFILVLLGMFMDVKIGVFTLMLTFVMTCIVLQRCSSSGVDLSLSLNGMFYLFLALGVFYILQIANPNNVQESWNIAIAHYLVYPIAMAIMIPIAIGNKRGIEILLIIWSIFIIFATLKGIWQKTYGFNARENYFLYVLGGSRTHIIWSGIRYFSFFSDAANYGVHSAMAATTFLISAFYFKKVWFKIYFLIVAACALYSMAISGTRAAVVIPFVGIVAFCFFIKNLKVIIIGSVAIIGAFVFFYYTNIGSSNPFIYKMRSAFRPTEDASYIVRLQNREKMKELMIDKPFGYGLGLSKGERFNPKEVMPYPPDSWLVSVWIETGIVGLILYLLIHGILFIWCGYIVLFKIRDKQLRGFISAWLSMDLGFFVAAYVNDIMQYPNSIVLYSGFALCFASLSIDKSIEKNITTQENITDKIEPNYFDI